MQINSAEEIRLLALDRALEYHRGQDMPRAIVLESARDFEVWLRAGAQNGSGDLKKENDRLRRMLMAIGKDVESVIGVNG